ncbi:MAG TPA: hypothetical protein VHZ24_02230, partial [Pirellulales bacterium]|nr:hypothetical protein [Pirellulales bacterium]
MTLAGALSIVVLFSAADGVDRSPVDLAVTSDDRWAVTANETADTVSLVDLVAGRVVDELPCGRRPSAVAISADDRLVLAAGAYSGDLTLYALADGKLRETARLAVGAEPRG